MPIEIVVALIAAGGSAIGAFCGILLNTKLVNHRIRQLENQVEKHNNILERTYILEEKVKVANHRIEDLEGFYKGGN